MRKRNLILALLLLAFIGTGSTFAWWYSGLENSEKEFDNTVTIGESNVKKTTLEIGDPGDDPLLLVPYGEKDNSVNPESVEEYKVYQFAVSWEQEEAAGEGKLTVTKGSVDFKGSDNLSDLSHLLLVYFSLTEPDIEAEVDFDTLETSLTDVPIELNDEDAIEVYVIVRLAQPEDQDEYDLVVGQTATFTINFLVTPNA